MAVDLLVPMVAAPRRAAARLVVAAEGLRCDAYLDDAGWWTIGVGHRLNRGAEPTVRRFTVERAASQLDADLLQAAARLPYFGVLSDGQRAALTSLAFNVGSLRGTRLVALIKAGAELQEIAAEWVSWDHAHVAGAKTELRGLLLRRLAEAKTFVSAA